MKKAKGVRNRTPFSCLRLLHFPLETVCFTLVKKTMVEFVKREFVLVAALVLAVASMFLVPPDKGYLSYIDYRTIGLLFSLMIVVQAFVRCGLFSLVSRKMLSSVSSVRLLSLSLVFLVFFSSMLVTNDVSLITFVPFTLLVFPQEDHRSLRFVVVMETIAANLGSMTLPFGNPQNLYLYNMYRLSFSAFFSAVAPLALVSLALLFLCVWMHKYEDVPMKNDVGTVSFDKNRFVVALLLFVVCILTVLRVADWRITLALVIVVFLVSGRELFANVDYFLLQTFVAFFVFVGNIARIPSVTGLVSSLLKEHQFLTPLLASQVISNVPAAILLSHFTDNGIALVLGTDIGGLGTLIASLASLISFKAYGKSGENKGSYLLSFTIWNLVFLLVLCLFAFVFHHV